jgi:peptide deformylase
MAQLEILVYPDERLRQVSQPVVEVNDEIKNFISDLEETLSFLPWCVGIAAPQVGRLERIIIVDVSSSPRHKNHGHLVLN